MTSFCVCSPCTGLSCPDDHLSAVRPRLHDCRSAWTQVHQDRLKDWTIQGQDRHHWRNPEHPGRWVWRFISVTSHAAKTNTENFVWRESHEKVNWFSIIKTLSRNLLQNTKYYHKFSIFGYFCIQCFSFQAQQSYCGLLYIDVLQMLEVGSSASFLFFFLSFVSVTFLHLFTECIYRYIKEMILPEQNWHDVFAQSANLEHFSPCCSPTKQIFAD